MSLQTRLAALISAIGTDIHNLSARITVLENPSTLDAGSVSTAPTNTVDGGTP